MNFVDVLQVQGDGNEGAAYAYNAAGQLVAQCNGEWSSPTSAGGNGPCYKFLSIGSTGGLSSFALQAPGIVTVLAGGIVGNFSIDVPAVSFAPTVAVEPSTLILLVLGLTMLAAIPALKARA